MNTVKTIPLFDRLHAIRHFASKQYQHQQMTQVTGKVRSEISNQATVIFYEKGHRRLDNGNVMTMTNTYCWQLLANDHILLSHLRLGRDKPVELVTFHPVNKHHWQCITPHLCGTDRYCATLSIDAHALYLNWDIQGAHKAIQIETRYLHTAK